jgi:hypothetical protein
MIRSSNPAITVSDDAREPFEKSPKTLEPPTGPRVDRLPGFTRYYGYRSQEAVRHLTYEDHELIVFTPSNSCPYALQNRTSAQRLSRYIS